MSNMASPLASSLESFKLPTDASPAQMKSGNFLNQLENMMNAVKKEAASLETMKQKIREMEELKIRFADLKNKHSDIEIENTELRRVLKDSESQNNEIRSDMQRLNDIYTSERTKHIEMQQQSLRTEQELSGIKLEKEHFYKESMKLAEQRKSNKALKGQMAQMKQLHEEEGKVFGGRILEAERKVQIAEKSKEEAATHFWHLTEEMNKLKNTLETFQMSSGGMATQLQETQALAAQYKDRILMMAEDLQHTRVRHALYLRSHKNELHVLQLELQNAQLNAITREDELASVTASYTYLQETSKADLLKLNLTASKLQETAKDLSGKNQELVKENAKMKIRLTSRDSDLDKYTAEIEQLRNAVTQADAVSAQKDVEAVQNLKVVTNQRDDATFQLLSVTAQLESIATQAKTDQARYWEELTRLKDGETQLLEECEKLTHELSEKTLRLHTLETEKTNAESNMRVEVNGASSMVNALKDELERRLEDLVTLRKERDSLLEDREMLNKLNEELRQELIKNDAMFKRTIETDRNKMKQEMTARTNRIKTLEMEKQEMLNEMNELVKQATDAGRAVTTAQNESEDFKIRADKLNEQMEWIKTKNCELLENIKTASTVEQELRDKFYSTETRLKEDINRLQTTITDTKKSSGVQVMELNNSIRDNFEEIEALKRQILTSNDGEKKANIECDRLRSGFETTTRLQEESAHQLKEELGTMRREVNELRGKSKLSVEAKTRVEMEIVTVRQQLDKAEAEIDHREEICRQLEVECNSLDNKSKLAQAATDAAIENSKALKVRVAELEETVAKKNQQLDHLAQDMQQLDREGLQETKRLRQQLVSAESEMQECRPLIPMLQKELMDVKANFARLQTTTNGDMGNLLEELRVAEDKLMGEKKKHDSTLAELQSKVTALTLQLEKKKEAVEDMQNRARADKSDRELSTMQLENELDRYRASAADKDRTVEELQKQHQNDRVKLLDLSKKVDTAERELIDAKTSLEMEQQQRKRLEAKLRQSISTGEHASVVRGDFANSPAPAGVAYDGGGYLSARSTFSRAGGERSVSGAYPSLRSESRDSAPRQQSNEYDDSSYVSGSYRNSSNGYESRTTHDEDGYRAMTPNRRSSAELAERALRASQSVPYLFNDGFQLSTNDSQARSPERHSDKSSHSRSPLSPRHTTSSYQAQSPAVERVSAALAVAARSSAPSIETGKNALKLAQQQRNASRANVSHDPYYDAVSPSNNIASSSWDVAPVAPISDSSAISMSTNEAIERTQRLLNKKRESSGQSAIQLTAPRPQPQPQQVDFDPEGSSGDYSNSTSKTPTSGRSSHKLAETIQHAHSMYPTNQSDMSFDADRQSSSGVSLSISTPSLQPASPPRGGGGGMRFNTSVLRGDVRDIGDGLGELNVDDNDDEEEEEETGRGPMGSGTSLRSSGTGPKKMRKKKVTTKKALDMDSLQLPKLSVLTSSTGSARRR